MAPNVPRARAELSFNEMLAMGTVLVRSGLLPEQIKNGAQAAAIILAGQELGMPPMRSLRSLSIVKGKLTEAADSQLARFKSEGGSSRWARLDAEVAELVVRHPNGDEHTETFTIEDARRAGLLAPQKNGEPSMYVKHPKAMLRSRAITAAMKSLGWEGGAGVYDPSELAPALAPAPSAEPDRLRPASREVRPEPRPEPVPTGDEHAPQVEPEDLDNDGPALGEPGAGPLGFLDEVGSSLYQADAAALFEHALSESGAVTAPAGMFDMGTPLAEPADPFAEPARAAPPPTEKQRKLLQQLAASRCFTEREKQRLLAVHTKKAASDAISWGMEQRDARKGRFEAAGPDEGNGGDGY